MEINENLCSAVVIEEKIEMDRKYKYVELNDALTFLKANIYPPYIVNRNKNLTSANK